MKQVQLDQRCWVNKKSAWQNLGDESHPRALPSHEGGEGKICEQDLFDLMELKACDHTLFS